MARVGPHVNRVYASDKNATIADHMAAALDAAKKEDFDAKAVQCFLMGPRDRTVHLGEGEGAEVEQFVKNRGASLIVHSAYRNNNPWRGDPTCAASIREELRLSAEAGAKGLVCHLPVGPHEWVLKFLPRLYTGHSVRIYLEHVASLPKNSHYESPEKIAALFKGIRRFDPTLRKVGFCIDTAHIWACGVDISSYENAEKWLNDLEAIAEVLPPDKIMFHLNDNKWGLGRGKDEHAALLEGEIWSKYRNAPKESGLAAFIDYAMRHSTIVILERKPPDKLLSDYRVLMDICPDLALQEVSTPPKKMPKEK